MKIAVYFVILQALLSTYFLYLALYFYIHSPKISCYV